MRRCEWNGTGAAVPGEELLCDGRRVVIDGQVVADISAHPAFAGRLPDAIAGLYDRIGAEPRHADLYRAGPWPAGVHRAHRVPRSDAEPEIGCRRLGLEADGRGQLRTRWPGSGTRCELPCRIHQCPRGVRPLRRQRRAVSDAGARRAPVWCTYTIIPPQIDRSKTAGAQAEPHLAAGDIYSRAATMAS